MLRNAKDLSVRACPAREVAASFTCVALCKAATWDTRGFRQLNFFMRCSCRDSGNDAKYLVASVLVAVLVVPEAL